MRFSRNIMKDYLQIISEQLDGLYEATIKVNSGDRVASGKFRNRPGEITKVDDNDGKPLVTIKLDDSLTAKKRKRKGKTKTVQALPFKKLKKGDKGYVPREDIPDKK